MTVLGINKPLDQGEPLLRVENKLAAGRHRFSLVVLNARGVASDPMFVTVTVGRTILRGPLGPLGPTGPIGRIEAPHGGAPARRRSTHKGPST